jgi:hypothetical protein
MFVRIFVFDFATVFQSNEVLFRIIMFKNRVKGCLLLSCLIMYRRQRFSCSTSQSMSHSLSNRSFLGGKDNSNDGKTHMNEASTTPISKHLLLYFAEFDSSKKPVFCRISLGGIGPSQKVAHANCHFLLPFVTANFLTNLVGQGSCHHQQFISMRPALRKRSVNQNRRSEGRTTCEQSHHHTNDSRCPILTAIFLTLPSCCRQQQESRDGLDNQCGSKELTTNKGSSSCCVD